jgi:hypothetical protein
MFEVPDSLPFASTDARSPAPPPATSKKKAAKAVNTAG